MTNPIQKPLQAAATAGYSRLRDVTSEIAMFVLCVAVLMVIMRDMLFRGATTVAHDTLYWLYPWYQYTAEHLLDGRIPLWNPFTHGGEPFYPLLAQLRFFDPISFVVLFLGAELTKDLLTLFAWDRFARGLVCCLGAYCLLRPWADHLLTRCSLLPILLFSSFYLGPFRQDAYLGHFIWGSWAMVFVFRIVCAKDLRWVNWIMAAGLIGLNWQSYYFAGTWVCLLLFAAGVVMFQRHLVMGMLSVPGTKAKLLVAALIIGSMCAPNIVLLLEQGQFVLPARMMDGPVQNGRALGGAQQWEIGPKAVVGQNNVMMSYEHVAHTGTFSRVLDFIQAATPFGNSSVSPHGWGNTSEAFMYFGFWVLIISMWGLLAGEHRLKGVWLIIGIGFALLMLGPAGGLHNILFHLYPPLWFLRNTHGLVLYFSVSVLFFYVIGCNQILATEARDLSWISRAPSEVMAWFQQLTTGEGLRSSLGISLIGLAGAMKPAQLERNWELIGHHLSQTEQAAANMLRIGLFLAGVLVLYLTLKERQWGDRIWSSLVMPALFVGLAFLSRMLPYALPFGLGLCIAAAGLLAWKARRAWGPTSAFLILSCGQVVTLLLMHPSIEYVLFLCAMLGIPLVGFLVLVRRSRAWSLHLALPAMVGLVIVCDLLGYLAQARGLWDMPRPDHALGFEAVATAPKFPSARILTIRTNHAEGPYGQAMRYQEVLHRMPTVFNPVMRDEAGQSPKLSIQDPDRLTQELIAARRWNSYLMLRPYFSTIYGGLPAATFRELFSIERPLIQFKDRWELLTDEQALAWLRSLDPDTARVFLEKTTIIAETASGTETSLIPSAISEPDKEIQEGGRGELAPQWTVRSYRYSSLDLDISTHRRRILLWVDGYDRHWKAYVDGREVPVFRANLNFKAVTISEGAHRVRFLYDPWAYRLSVKVFLSVQILVAVLSLVLWLKSRMSPISDPNRTSAQLPP